MATNTKNTPAPELSHFEYTNNAELTLSFTGSGTPFAHLVLFDDQNNNGIKDTGELFAGMPIGSDGHWSLNINVGQLTPESSFAIRSMENNGANVSDIAFFTYTQPIPQVIPPIIPVPTIQLSLTSNVTTIVEPNKLALTTLPLSVTYSLSQGTPNGLAQLTNLGSAKVGEDLHLFPTNLNVVSSDSVNQSATIQLDAQGAASFTLSALEDNLVEGDESLIIKATDLLNPSNNVTAPLVVVQDSTSAPMPEITHDQSQIYEPSFDQDGAVSIVTRVIYSISGEANAIVNVSNKGSAIVGEDVRFTALNGIWSGGDAAQQTASVKLDGNGLASFSLVTRADTKIEGDENLLVSVSNGKQTVTSDPVVVHDVVTPLKITPNLTDIFEPAINQSSASNPTQVSYTISGAPNQIVTLRNTGTAKVGDDLSALPVTFAWINPDVLQQTANIKLNDQGTATFSFAALADKLTEGNETLNLIVTDALSPSINAFAQTVALHDTPQRPPLQITADQSAIFETASSNSPVQVNYTIKGGTANATVNVSNAGTAILGVDTTEKPASITLDANGSASFSLTAVADKITEGDETLIISVTDTLDSGNGATASAVIIRDTPVVALPILTFSETTVSVIEGNQSLNQAILTVNLSSPATQTVTVAYQTNLGTATGDGVDYINDVGVLTFAPGESSKPIKLQIVGDTLVEPDENFTVSLNNPSNTALLGANSIATVIIKNDDAIPTLSFKDASVSIIEGNGGNQPPKQAALTVNLSAPTTQPVTVAYQTNNGTALGNGVDYDNTLGILTFAPGEISKVINVPIVGDTLQELNENFSVALKNPSSNAILGTIANADVTITNDDITPILGFKVTNVSVIEGTGNNPINQATLTVELSAPAAQAVTVDYHTAEGTAKGPTTVPPILVVAPPPFDFQTSGGTLTFAPGVTIQTINIPINGDALIEPDETFSVNLTAPSSNVILGAANSAIVTITNDDFPTVYLQNAAMSVSEVIVGTPTPSQALIAVNLSSAFTQAVSVHYATSNGTAIASTPQLPGDYLATNGILTFEPGVTQQTFSVPINVDHIYYEPDETFFITLTGVSNNAILGVDSSTITILTNYT
ncbi:MAG: hypothetical protein HOP02_04710 [Methylococcaceae bacterium]|nr:hypothetical protein [Methylococcaceae bacterium]